MSTHKMSNKSTTPATILIVDDKEKIRTSLSLSLKNRGYYPLSAASIEEGWEKIILESVDLALIDIRLGDENGLDLLRKIQTLESPIPVLIFTGHATIESAIEAIKLGAFNYLQKPVKVDQLAPMIGSALKLSKLEQENKELLMQIRKNDELLIEGEVLENLFRKTVKLAKSELPILIQGESGTGKEMFAELIHNNSSRKDCPLIKINCAALPESLLDDELFGHEKGAFTGADKQFRGVFERAHGGTLFLDELGDMSLQTQAKILRAIQNREIKRLGGNSELEVDVRFIAATNKDLDTMMAEKIFREDLYYRLSTAVITIPPLRERKETILQLTEHFLNQCSGDSIRKQTLSPDVSDFLVSYDWPGNVRELKSTVQYASAVASSPMISLDDLPRKLTDAIRPRTSGKLHQEMEEDLIKRVMKECGNNKKRTAEILGISRATLYNKIKDYNLP
ncbi:MAG: sigma-54 dependent transcriptional regulator [Spirochaetales bacterium]|nr:sigma-54 dependent transcriptional regulator [Spirochaetales bacterium]